jgi:hypothetical protein
VIEKTRIVGHLKGSTTAQLIKEIYWLFTSAALSKPRRL